MDTSAHSPSLPCRIELGFSIASPLRETGVVSRFGVLWILLLWMFLCRYKDTWVCLGWSAVGLWGHRWAHLPLYWTLPSCFQGACPGFDSPWCAQVSNVLFWRLWAPDWPSSQVGAGKILNLKESVFWEHPPWAPGLSSRQKLHHWISEMAGAGQRGKQSVSVLPHLELLSCRGFLQILLFAFLWSVIWLHFSPSLISHLGFLLLEISISPFANYSVFLTDLQRLFWFCFWVTPDSA